MRIACRMGDRQDERGIAMIKVYREKDYAAMSQRAADIIAAEIIHKPDCILGLATGSTPIGTYENLVEKYQAGELDFAKVRTFNLDEYVGLTPDNDQSYHYFMKDHLFSHVNIDMDNTHVPDGAAADPDAACKAYDAAMIAAGGTDIQLLGLGQNGHVGFNEPADAFPTGTHIVELTQSTIEANSRLFDDISEVPTRAITMGIMNIFLAKKILLVANGPKKADAVKKMLYGPVTPDVPASILQLHPDVTVVVDEEALPEMK